MTVTWTVTQTLVTMTKVMLMEMRGLDLHLLAVNEIVKQNSFYLYHVLVLTLVSLAQTVYTLQSFVGVGVKSGLISRRSAATKVSGVRLVWGCKWSLGSLDGGDGTFILKWILDGGGPFDGVLRCVAGWRQLGDM